MPSFEPKTDELKDFSCLFRAWFVLFFVLGSCYFRALFLCHFRAWFVPRSSMVCAIFEPGSFHFRAWLVPFSSLVCSIFEPGSFHFRAWFVPFSSLVRAIFDPAFYPFRVHFVPFSSIVQTSLRCSRLISFAKEIKTGYMISYYVLLF